ncbi:MAG: hypothetical protein H0W44_07320 [Gammaproteobacteria bacterium]|nr:hypothetical protein [Gammaproteobacteria bacterium]
MLASIVSFIHAFLLGFIALGIYDFKNQWLCIRVLACYRRSFLCLSIMTMLGTFAYAAEPTNSNQSNSLDATSVEPASSPAKLPIKKSKKTTRKPKQTPKVFICPVPVDTLSVEPITPENPNNPEQPDSALLEKAQEQRDNIGEYFIEKAEDLDYFFSRRVWTEPNESKLQLDIGEIFRKDGDRETIARIRAKLDLPSTQYHLRLFFDTDSDDRKTLEQQSLDTLRQNSIGKESSEGGLELLSNEIDSWKFRNRLGLKSGGLKPFYKFTARRELDVEEPWSGQFKQEFIYYEEQDWRSNTTFNIGENFRKNKYRGAVSQIQFFDLDDTFAFSQTFSISEDKGELRSIVYSVGTFGSSEPKVQFNDYFISVAYRQPLYKKWCFLRLSQDVVFPRYDSHRPNPAFAVQMEILFTE